MGFLMTEVIQHSSLFLARNRREPSHGRSVPFIRKGGEEEGKAHSSCGLLVGSHLLLREREKWRVGKVYRHQSQRI
jgi:hypothetical protein